MNYGYAGISRSTLQNRGPELNRDRQSVVKGRIIRIGAKGVGTRRFLSQEARKIREEHAAGEKKIPVIAIEKVVELDTEFQLVPADLVGNVVRSLNHALAVIVCIGCALASQ